MKRYKLIMLLLIAMTLITACDNVYYSAVSGHVEDANNKGIGGVNVYAYRSQSERDAKFNSYEVGKPFDDPSCLFRATTAANGDFSIGKVVWKTSKSEWGKDYASTTLYLIFFSEEYGIQKSDGINIISGSANSSSITVNIGNSKMTTETLVLNFKDSTGVADENLSAKKNVLDTTLNFSYSYNNGYRNIEEDVSVGNGTITLQIKHSKDINPEVKISNIKCATDEEVWMPYRDEYICTLERSTQTFNIPMERKMWNLGSGISGRVETKISSLINLNGATVVAEIVRDESTTDTTYVSSNDTVDEHNKKYVGSFSGLFADRRIPVSGSGDELMIKIRVTTIDGTGTGNGIVTIDKTTGLQTPITIQVSSGS